MKLRIMEKCVKCGEIGEWKDNTGWYCDKCFKNKVLKEVRKMKLDDEEKEYIFWLIHRKDKVRHIAEDIIFKIGMDKLEDYQFDGVLAKWDKITKEDKKLWDKALGVKGMKLKLMKLKLDTLEDEVNKFLEGKNIIKTSFFKTRKHDEFLGFIVYKE